MASKAAARREAILNAAEALLSEQGYGEFGLRAVAARAGMRLSHVQYYFPSVAELLSALVEQVLSGADAKIRSLPAGDVAGLVTMLMDEHDGSGSCRMFWDLWALAGRDKDADKVLTSFYDGYLERMAERIAEECPETTPAACREKAAVIVALVEGMSLLRAPGRTARLAPNALQGVLATARAVIAMPWRTAPDPPPLASDVDNGYRRD